ncbi:hypothetical protein PUNSTDRAFT_127270 [Punctularia strigosozonata HHB-11173 SS5]|uniref:uncharacterized protein n=1 Tax=Punctularia strigosozonata (strain HHB-11173) TaxID=741275 RepID=UPI0004417060|nr:uncharacterized protein PUNSTDRAFT_127270 [Punctularia strigosozonata HHB-11173 SS5]EIN06512.1 hypothetical protein PUNSTDRAFT_127270 [Punctularia strigosozonata HHB-11173 SS5]
MKLLAFVAFAVSPLFSAAQAPDPFTITALHSGEVNIHLQPINANSQAFWIGRPTSTFCPNPASECPPGTQTAFIGGSSTLELDDEVPGGQQIYVQSNGALGYTAPHSAVIPAGATLTGFFWTGGAAAGDLGFIGLGATSFIACPTTSGGPPYQIFENVAGGDFSSCIGFDARTTEYSGGDTSAAWEYA